MCVDKRSAFYQDGFELLGRSVKADWFSTAISTLDYRFACDVMHYIYIWYAVRLIHNPCPDHIHRQDLLTKHTEESNASLKTREAQEEEVSTVVECLI